MQELESQPFATCGDIRNRCHSNRFTSRRHVRTSPVHNKVCPREMFGSVSKNPFHRTIDTVTCAYGTRGARVSRRTDRSHEKHVQFQNGNSEPGWLPDRLAGLKGLGLVLSQLDVDRSHRVREVPRFVVAPTTGASRSPSASNREIASIALLHASIIPTSVTQAMSSSPDFELKALKRRTR